MNTTETRTTLGAECDTLLALCLDPLAHHDEIGRVLRIVAARHDDLKDSAEYWLLQAMATELYRPFSARRFVPRLMRHAYGCADIDTFRPPYAQWRVDALQRRTERSRASISDTLREAYSRRLEQAKDELQDILHGQ